MRSDHSTFRLIHKRSDGTSIQTSIDTRVASSFVARLIGLLSRAGLSDREALLLKPCGSIHTFGMRFTIDVLFLGADGRVVGAADEVKPNRIRLAPRGTVNVLEIAQGNRRRTGINLDDYLNFD